MTSGSSFATVKTLTTMLLWRMPRTLIAAIAPNDSKERFTGLGVRVIEGEARFTDAKTVAVGDQVEAAAGNEMPGFHSRTLDRTFEQITFAPAARVLGAGGARPAAAPGATPATPTAAPAVPAAAHPTGTPGALPPGHSGAMPAGHPPV